MDLVTFFKSLPPSFTEFLAFIATPTVLGPILSELLEYSKWFQERTAAAKTLILYVVMALVGLLSFSLVHWVPAAALEQLQPVYAVLAASAAFFISSQTWHNKQHEGAGGKVLTTEIKTAAATVKTEEAPFGRQGTLDDYVYTERSEGGVVTASKEPLPFALPFKEGTPAGVTEEVPG